MSFRFVSDDEGNWYVVPADKVIEYGKYLDALERFWEDYEGDESEPSPPEWLVEIKDGPESVLFPSYEIK